MKRKILLSTTLILLLSISAIMTVIPFAYAQAPTRKTTAYLSVAPPLLGLGQSLTVNLWIYPSPATLSYSWLAEAFENITIAFTRPDGTKDTFMPVDGSGGLGPGQSEMIGAIWFLYTPNQVGTWTAQFTFPGQTLGPVGDSVYYEPSTSQSVSFTVQKDPVNAGILNGWPLSPLPTGYWTSPINSDNREWSQISGNWLQRRYDCAGNSFNPYSKAPNTGHILWTNQVDMGGLVGGAWGSLSVEDTTGGSPPVIMMGKVYYNMAGGVFRCVDLYTGELICEKSGTVTLAQILRASTRDVARDTPESQGAPVQPRLWELGKTSWKLYNPLTGALLQTISNVPAPASTQFGVSGTFTTYFSEGDPVVYIIYQSGWNTTIPRRWTQSNLMKWDYSKVTGNDWMTGVVWNVSMKQADGTGPGEGARGSGLYFYGDAGIVFSTGEETFYGYDLKTGTQVWTKKLDYADMHSYYWNKATGHFLGWDSANRVMHLYDINTGKELWESVPLSYPWGSQLRYPAYAYGNIYIATYEGYVYSIDETTGVINWKFFTGNTTENVYGTWIPYGDSRPIVADGKIYISTSEHSPTQPRMRGNMLFCIDAYTGKQVWNISGAIGTNYMGPPAIAEGYYIGTSENDGVMYCIGKGQTVTTVTAPQTVVPKGTGFLISGSVMDMSPAQPNTPAIADADMSEWMDYLHMQKAMPAKVNGVPVLLTATAPDGSTINIGTVTSDGYGNFFYEWTPPNTGMYKIQATFAGSESYWSSTAETAAIVKSAAASASPLPTETTVTPAPSTPTSPASTASPTASVPQSVSPSPTVAPPPAGEEPSMTLYVATAGIVIVIVAVAAVLLILRRRAK